MFTFYLKIRVHVFKITSFAHPKSTLSSKLFLKKLGFSDEGSTDIKNLKTTDLNKMKVKNLCNYHLQNTDF
jgi:hypothetical protein